jgi:hypothetical protein
MTKPSAIREAPGWLSWLAGIVDADGSPNLSRGRHLVLKVEMEDEDTVRQCLAFTGLGTVGGPYGPYGKGHKPMWVWRVYGNEAAYLMMRLYPLMSERRQVKFIECIVAWWTPERAVFMNARLLKTRGPEHEEQARHLGLTLPNRPSGTVRMPSSMLGGLSAHKSQTPPAAVWCEC